MCINIGVGVYQRHRFQLAGPMVEDEGGGLFGGQDGPCVCVYLHCSGRCKHAVGPSRGVGWMEGMRCGRVCACSY